MPTRRPSFLPPNVHLSGAQCMAATLSRCNLRLRGGDCDGGECRMTKSIKATGPAAAAQKEAFSSFHVFAMPLQLSLLLSSSGT